MDGTSLTPEQDKFKALRQILPEAFSEGWIEFKRYKRSKNGKRNQKYF